MEENEILKRAATFLARENVLPKRASGWSKNLPRGQVLVAVACRMLPVSTSVYLEWRARAPRPVPLPTRR